MEMEPYERIYNARLSAESGKKVSHWWRRAAILFASLSAGLLAGKLLWWLR